MINSLGDMIMEFMEIYSLNSGCTTTNTVKDIQINKENDNMDVSNETKTVLTVDDRRNIKVISYDNGKFKSSCSFMPDFQRVRTYSDQEGHMRAMFVDFVDGTTTSASVHNDDVFSLEQGLSICITKRLLSVLVGPLSGHQVYNKLIRRAVKLYEKQQIEKKREKEAEAATKQKAEKLAIKKRKRIERMKKNILDAEALAREEIIEIQKEAYLRAMRQHDEEIASSMAICTNEQAKY